MGKSNDLICIEAKFNIHITDVISVVSANGHVEELLGYDSRELLSGNILFVDLIHTDDQDIADTLFSSQTTDTPHIVNLRLRQKNRRIRCIKATYQKHSNDDGLILKLLLQDAKSLKRTMDEATNMVNFQAIMENTDDYIYFKDRNHVFTGASQILVELCDPSEHWTDLLGRTDYDVFPEEYADIYYHLEKQVFAGVSIAHEIQETLTKEGKKGWVDNRKYPIHDKDGNIIGLYGIARDITDRIQAEEALQQANKVVEKSPVVLFRWKAIEGRPVEFISSNIKQFGYTANELLSGDIPYNSIIHPDDIEKVTHEVKQHSLSGEDDFTQEYRIVSPTGEIFWIDDRTTIERDDEGNIIHYQGVILDITERKQADDEKQRLQRELQSAMKMEALGQVTGGVAHHFNNLLGIILGYTELASSSFRTSGDSLAVGYLNRVKKAGEEAAMLISQMLAFFQDEQSELETTSLVPLIKNTIKSLNSTLPATIQITPSFEDNLPHLEFDPVQLKQMLMILVDNACDAMQQKGNISINLCLAKDTNEECSTCHKKLDGNWLCLSVSDTGVGIKPENIEKIFTPFFTTKDVGKGTGLQLEIALGIMHLHNGHMLVDSEVGKGTTFRLMFPV